MSRPLNCPPNAVVERVIAEEAQAADCRVFEVMHYGRRAVARVARRKAIVRIIAETGCSHAGLSRVWGVAETTIRKALKWRDPPPPPAPLPHPYDRVTIGRFLFQHGPERTAQILAGYDPATNGDIGKWVTLGLPKAGALA